jgi:hypothetical protein
MTRIEPDAHAVASIMFRPYAVVDEEISRQGSLPMVAPVKPYTLQHIQYDIRRTTTYLTRTTVAAHIVLHRLKTRWHIHIAAAGLDTSATVPVCRHLQCQLPPIKHRQLEFVRLCFHVCLRSAGRMQSLLNPYAPLPHMSATHGTATAVQLLP